MVQPCLMWLKPPPLSEAFKKPEQRLLVVANKFQTGFDQPLLHTMYVDKKLGSVAAGQTLSRLNRIAPGKQDTMVLVFVNSHEVIRAAFQDYYQRTELEGETNKNKLYSLKHSLEKMDVLTSEQLGMEHKGKKDYEQQKAEAQNKFRKGVGRYVRSIPLSAR